jgi:hypothetical protein
MPAGGVTIRVLLSKREKSMKGVTPAGRESRKPWKHWIPAFAGMTKKRLSDDL